jgi:hypothetical protein
MMLLKKNLWYHFLKHIFQYFTVQIMYWNNRNVYTGIFLSASIFSIIIIIVDCCCPNCQRETRERGWCECVAQRVTPASQQRESAAEIKRTPPLAKEGLPNSRLSKSHGAESNFHYRLYLHYVSRVYGTTYIICASKIPISISDLT